MTHLNLHVSTVQSFLPKNSLFHVFKKQFTGVWNLRYEFYGMFQNSFRKNFGKNFETNLRCLIMNEHELCYRKNYMRTKNCKTPFLSE